MKPLNNRDMKTITHNGVPCVEAKVHMLPTEDASCIAFHKLRDEEPGLFYSDKPSVEKAFDNQHLYFTTDEEIKKGDWFINLGSGGHPGVAIYQANSENSKAINEFKFPEIKKIIATTDTELHYNKVVEEDMHMYKESLPHIPQHIIEAYVKKPFDKVLVEMTGTEWKEHTKIWMESMGDDPEDFEKKSELKTDSNNCIIIHPVEEKTYSRKEVEVLCRNAHLLGMKETLPGYPKPETIDEWIKENL